MLTRRRFSLDMLAAIYGAEAENAAWEAYLAGVPLSWLGGRR